MYNVDVGAGQELVRASACRRKPPGGMIPRRSVPAHRRPRSPGGMPAMRRLLVLASLILPSTSSGQATSARVVRFATFNASLNREGPGALIRDLSTRENAQARNVAEIIQRVAPD